MFAFQNLMILLFRLAILLSLAMSGLAQASFIFCDRFESEPCEPPPFISIGEVPELVPGQNGGLPVSLSEPAPAGGVILELESADTLIATVDATVQIPEGASVPASNPQVNAISVGTTQITAKTEGFAADTRTVTVNKFVLSFSSDPIQLFEGWTDSYTLTLSSSAPVGGLIIDLTVDDEAILSAPETVTIPAGQTTVGFDITGENEGSSTLLAQAPDTEDALVDVNVGPMPDITLNDFNVGEDLQDDHRVRLTQSPPNPVDITLNVTDPGVAVISADRTTVGSSQIVFSGVDSAASQFFYVQGLSQGSTTITATAPGFNDASATLTVTDSGFYISSPSSISTTTFSNNTNVFIAGTRLNNDGSRSTAQEVRAGLTVEVPVASSNTSIGEITTSPVVFNAGDGASQSTQFDPKAAGNTTVSMTQPAGFTAPTNGNQSIEAEVTAPDITLNDFNVGEDLQDDHRVRLTQSPPNPVDITLNVTDPGVAVISADRTTVGSSQIVFSGVDSAASQFFYVQGLSQGSTTITATAPGFNDASATLTVTDSGFYISSPSSISTTTFSNNTNVFIAGTRLNNDGSRSTAQEVRAGLTVEVPVASSNTSIGEITTSPVVFNAGDGASQSTQFDPKAAGNTTVSMTQPAGFTAPTNGNQSIEAEVTAPDITLNDFSVGEDLQDDHRVRLTQSPPNPVDITLNVTDPGVAVISADRTTVGSSQIVFSGVDSAASQFFYVQGLSQGSTTITATAPGFNDASATLTVTDSGFYISSPSSISTTTFSNNTNVFIAGTRLNNDGSRSTAQEVRAGLTVEVPVASSNTSIGEITTSPVVFNAGDGASQSTQFDPKAAGNTTVSMTQPAGFTAPTNGNQSIEAEVTAPDITLNDFNVGEDLQDDHRVRLTQSPPNPVDITLNVTDPGVAVISADRTTVGSSQIVFSGVDSAASQFFYVQGLSQGSTTITATAPGFNDASATLTVTDSGFYISSPSSISTTTFSNNTNVFIAGTRLNNDGSRSTAQEVRAGLTVEVPVASSNTSIGEITTSPVVFNAGDGVSQSTQFDPKAAGNTTVSVTQPTGFTAPTNGNQSIAANVTDG